MSTSEEWPDAVPQNVEERLTPFEMKRQIVKTLVEKVLIEKDRRLRVVFHPDVVRLLEQLGVTDQIDSAGIYTRRFDLIRHRHTLLVEL